MAVGPFCAHCNTHVRLDPDGRSCSNCKATLVRPDFKPAPTNKEP